MEKTNRRTRGATDGKGLQTTAVQGLPVKGDLASSLAALGESLEEGRVYAIILEQALLLSGWDAAFLCLNRRGCTLHFAAQRNLAPATVQGLQSHFSQGEPCWLAALGLCQQAELCPNLDTKPGPAEACPPGLEAYPERAWIPLQGQGCCLAILGLVSRKGSDEALSQVKALATPFALAIQNAAHHALVLQTMAGLEALVRKRTADLETSNMDLEAFCYSVSHDLRAPLRAVTGFTQILKEDYSSKLDAEGQRLLGIVYTEGLRMGRLIDDLLSFSRLGRQALNEGDCDLYALVQEVRAELMAREPARQVRWTLEPLPLVRADPSLLRQVLINLLGNALKYTRLREVAEIEIDATLQGEECLCYVRDNGVGFDPRYAHKLFGVFQRLHNREEFEGNGVGLALCQRLLHRHGGRIWAEGRPGQGATFYFSLKAVERGPGNPH